MTGGLPIENYAIFAALIALGCVLIQLFLAALTWMWQFENRPQESNEGGGRHGGGGSGGHQREFLGSGDYFGIESSSGGRGHRGGGGGGGKYNTDLSEEINEKQNTMKELEGAKGTGKNIKGKMDKLEKEHSRSVKKMNKLKKMGEKPLSIEEAKKFVKKKAKLEEEFQKQQKELDDMTSEIEKLDRDMERYRK